MKTLIEKLQEALNEFEESKLISLLCQKYLESNKTFSELIEEILSTNISLINRPETLKTVVVLPPIKNKKREDK